MTDTNRKQRKIISGKVDRSKPASRVIDAFGGLTRFCELTGYASSTAHGWTVSGYIPAHRKGQSIHGHILAVAGREGVKIEPGDFVDSPALAGAPANG